MIRSLGLAKVRPEGLRGPGSEPELDGCLSTTLTPACLNGLDRF